MMRRSLAALVICLLWVWPASATDVQVVRSDAGHEAWLVTERAIPLVSIVMAFEGGARTDPAGREGLVQVMSALLTEGAGDLEAQAFKQALADRAIRLSAGANHDTVYVTLQTLTEHLDPALDLLRLALTEPRFDDAAVERIRAQMLSVLQREAEDPDTIADRAWTALAFGGHAYARPENGTPQSIAAITRDEIAAARTARLTRDRLHVAVVGDIAADDLKPRLDALVGALPATAASEAHETIAPAGAGTLVIIPREDPQSRIVWGAPGLLRGDPDFQAASVLNYVLGGGGFSSRLMDEVREKRGLVYGVSTWLDPMEFAGLYRGSLATDNAKAAEALGLVKSEMARLRDEGMTEAELTDAKAYLTGSFALRLDSNAKIANALIAAALDDLGPDYLQRRNAEIEAVTMDDIRRVATRLLQPDALSVVVVGAPVGLEAVPAP